MDTKQLHGKVAKVKAGELDALSVYATLTLLKKEVEGMITEVKSEALEEAKNEDEKTFSKNGIQYSFTNGRANYDFKSDAVYTNYYKHLKDRESLMKQATKAWELGNQIVDENGEIVPPATVKYSADSLSVKLVN